MTRDRHGRHALLVGVTDYAERTGFGALKGPLNDVRELRRVLSGPEGAFDEANVVVVENPGRADDLRGVIGDFLGEGEPGDELLVYFSGHGELDDRGTLHLTHVDTKREALNISGVSWADLSTWAQDSRARAVCFVLDCCRSGFAEGKGGEAISAALAQPLTEQPRRVRQVLAAVPGRGTAEDAKHDDGLSPFTERFIAALVTAEPAEDGTVGVDTVLTRLHDLADAAKVPRPLLRGEQAERTVRLGQRADYAVRRLARAGLEPADLHRTGALVVDGVEVRVPTRHATEVATRLRRNHPTAVLIGDKPGTGKTWVLCDIADRLADEDWDVISLQPGGGEPDAGELVDSLLAYIDGRPFRDRTLLTIDNLTFSDAWAQVIEQIALVAGERKVSILLAADGLETTHWRMPGGSMIPAPGTTTELPRFVEAMAGTEAAGIGALDQTALKGLTKSLQDLANTDLWAVVHLAGVIGDPDAEHVVAEELWRSRLQDLGPNEINALAMIAGLSWFGIWCPPDEHTYPGTELAVRVGADRSGDRVRLNSVFVIRALLGRDKVGGPLTLDRNRLEDKARHILQLYLAYVLKLPSRHTDALQILKDLDLHRTSFDEVVADLAGAKSSDSVLRKWELGCASVATVAATFLVIRTALPFWADTHLTTRIAERIVSGDAADLNLPALLDCLQALRTARGGDRTATVVGARTALVELVGTRLAESRHPAEQRWRAVTQLLRFGDSEAVTSLGDLLPDLIRPGDRVREEDLRLLVDLVQRLTRSGTEEGRLLAGSLAGLPEVTEVMDGAASDASGSAPRFLAAWIVASHVLGRWTDADRTDQLRRAVGGANLGQIQRVVAFCNKHHPELSKLVLGWIDNPHRRRGLYAAATPGDLADWLATMGRTDPDRAARWLRRSGNRVDSTLSSRQATMIVETSDRVGCGKLLQAAAHVEDQADRLEGGFAETLAAELGTAFLADQLRIEHRTTVMVHLIVGFLRANLEIDAHVRHAAVDLVEQHIRWTNSERGPKLALTLAEPSAVGEEFLDELTARPKLKHADLLAAMQKSMTPAAVVAFHSLAVLMYPGIAVDYREWLDEGELRSRTFLGELRESADLAATLRAANAIARTLMLTGDTDGGRQLMSLIEQYADGDWSRRLWSLNSRGLAESLSLLRKLDRVRAQEIVRASTDQLKRTLARSAGEPGDFAALVRAIGLVDSGSAQRLTEHIIDVGAAEVLTDQLTSESNTFEQVELVYQLEAARGSTGGRIVSAPTLTMLVENWRLDIPRISNPRILARILETCAGHDLDTAMEIGRGLKPDYLRSRFGRRLRREADDMLYLADVLFDIEPSLATGLLDDDLTVWLLRNVSIERLPALVEIVMRGIHTVDGIDAVTSRLAMVGTRALPSDVRTIWLATGQFARAAGQFAHKSLSLPEPQVTDSLVALPSLDVVDALAWLAPAPWHEALVETAYSTLLAQEAPLDDPDDCARLLAVGLRLGRLGSFDAEQVDTMWRLALDARSRYLRPLSVEISGGSTSVGLSAELAGEFRALGQRLLSGRLRWRRMIHETATALIAVTSEKGVSRPGEQSSC